MDGPLGEDEAPPEARTDEYERRLDASVDEIEPFEQQRTAVESASRRDWSEE